MSEDTFTNDEEAIEHFLSAQRNEKLCVFARNLINENRKLKRQLSGLLEDLHDYQETGPSTLNEARTNVRYLKGANMRKFWAIVLLSTALACTLFSCHNTKKQLRIVQQRDTVRQ